MTTINLFYTGIFSSSSSSSSSSLNQKHVRSLKFFFYHLLDYFQIQILHLLKTILTICIYDVWIECAWMCFFPFFSYFFPLFLSLDSSLFKGMKISNTKQKNTYDSFFSLKKKNNKLVAMIKNRFNVKWIKLNKKNTNN